MKLDRPFNTLSLAEYRQIIPRHAKYTDFNPLALYRSILENCKLSEAGRQEVLVLANQYSKSSTIFWWRRICTRMLRSRVSACRRSVPRSNGITTNSCASEPKKSSSASASATGAWVR